MWSSANQYWKRAWTFVLLVACGDAGAAPVADAGASMPLLRPRHGLIVQVGAGIVEGIAQGASRAFLGIPFAEPPVGTLRFAPPQPVRPWSGVRSAGARGPDCPQPLALDSSEDCLTLDVVAPARSAPQLAPVMVFIHGGGYNHGGTAAYDTSLLSEAGGTVVVSVHYRLGALGFLAHAELDAELGASSGNMGLRDQQAALRWVRDNIRAFGGDPENVTLFGQSAGAMSTCLHMFARGSERLAQRFVLQSGACLGPQTGFALSFSGGPRSRAQILASSAALIADLCRDQARDPIACLRALPADALAGWAPAELARLELGLLADLTVAGVLGTGFAPHVDGELLPARPSELLRAGRFVRAPLIAGTTEHEWELFAPFLPAVETRAAFERWTRTLFTEHTEQLLTQYMPGDDQAARAAWIRLNGDRLLRCPTQALLRGLARHEQRLYQYRFAVPPAAHAQDLDYVFGNEQTSLAFPFEAPLPLLPQVVAAMQQAWAGFAHTGDPNASEPAVRWPRFDPAQPRALVFSETSAVVQASPDDPDCDFWQALYPDDFH